MDTIVEAIEKDGYTLTIYYDETPDSPRNWGNIGKLYISRPPRGYTLSDKDANEEEFKAAPVKLPVYILDHSGLAISTSRFGDPWDSWQAGYIYVTAETLKFEYLDNGYTMQEAMEAARECLKGEIELFNDYVQGNVYGYEITDESGVLLDSCWGYYGDSGIRDIKDIFDRLLTIEKEKKAKEARAAAIEAAPLFVWGGINPETLQAVNA